MTCEEQWKTIKPGSVVRFKDGTVGTKLADQWERYDGVDGNCLVNKSGLIDHLSYYAILHEPYTDQFAVIE